jgi:uracil-DNA glycosylase
MTTTPTQLTSSWLAGVDPSWMPVLESVRPALESAAAAVLGVRARGGVTLPEDANVLRALRTPLADVRVLIVGQDPYPTPGNAVGLAFSVGPSVDIPASLRNIFRELVADVGVSGPDSGDLSPWSSRGVLLLNRVLTVDAGAAGSMRGHGWEEVTQAVVRALVAREAPLVAILWGNDAATLAAELGDVPIIASAHPSPLSARKGFFGSRPFSHANAALVAQGAEPIDWSLGEGAPTLFDANFDS